MVLPLTVGVLWPVPATLWNRKSDISKGSPTDSLVGTKPADKKRQRTRGSINLHSTTAGTLNDTPHFKSSSALALIVHLHPPQRAGQNPLSDDNKRTRGPGSGREWGGGVWTVGVEFWTNSVKIFVPPRVISARNHGISVPTGKPYTSMLRFVFLFSLHRFFSGERWDAPAGRKESCSHCCSN